MLDREPHTLGSFLHEEGEKGEGGGGMKSEEGPIFEISIHVHG